MKPVILEAPAFITEQTGATMIMVCEAHPRNWIEEQYIKGQEPDTTQFCNCCTGDCTPFCRSCDNKEVGA
jgi:hypothetical protein